MCTWESTCIEHHLIFDILHSTDEADNEMESSPDDDSGDISEDEETSEENSYNDDSNDEDYQPPFYIQ